MGKKLSEWPGSPMKRFGGNSKKILRRAKHQKLIELVQKSDQLLQDLLNGDNEAAAKAIQDVHDTMIRRIRK